LLLPVLAPLDDRGVGVGEGSGVGVSVGVEVAVGVGVGVSAGRGVGVRSGEAALDEEESSSRMNSQIAIRPMATPKRASANQPAAWRLSVAKSGRRGFTCP
jgi:hypothetical protein